MRSSSRGVRVWWRALCSTSCSTRSRFVRPRPQKAANLYTATKGRQVLVQDDTVSHSASKHVWIGGTESDMFNRLEAIANEDTPKTPVGFTAGSCYPLVKCGSPRHFTCWFVERWRLPCKSHCPVRLFAFAAAGARVRDQLCAAAALHGSEQNAVPPEPGKLGGTIFGSRLPAYHAGVNAAPL